MENKTHYFEAHGKDYKLEVAKDMYGWLRRCFSD